MMGRVYAVAVAAMLLAALALFAVVAAQGFVGAVG